tara:strand:- start:7023 stop:7292 length:270 start_codon:yes stop_codon:yes gene_type:complete
MKKGYHDYIPIIKDVEEEQEIKKEKTHEPKYVTSHGGLRYKISDERGMVVAATDILMFGSKLPSHSYNKVHDVNLKMDTKSYIKYNGHL